MSVQRRSKKTASDPSQQDLRGYLALLPVGKFPLYQIPALWHRLRPPLRRSRKCLRQKTLQLWTVLGSNLSPQLPLQGHLYQVAPAEPLHIDSAPVISTQGLQSMIRALPAKADLNTWAAQIKEAFRLEVDTIKQQVSGMSTTAEQLPATLMQLCTRLDVLEKMQVQQRQALVAI